MRKKKKHSGLIVLLIATSLSELWGIFGLYCGVYYHALPRADDALKSSASIKVRRADWLTSFEPAAPSSLGYIFYPGGKVESKAYAPFCRALSEKGNPTYLVTMPYNLAFFDLDRATALIEGHPNVASWVLLGHSLGGAMGVRDFSGEDVPRHNRVGNRLSALYFRLATRVKLSDTQTGLRGIPANLFALALASHD